MFSTTQPFTPIIKMKANHNIATKGKTDRVKFPASQTLFSSLKGPCQSLVDPATALVWQILMRNLHMGWPLSGPNGYQHLFKNGTCHQHRKQRLHLCPQCVLTHLSLHCDLSQHCSTVP